MLFEDGRVHRHTANGQAAVPTLSSACCAATGEAFAHTTTVKSRCAYSTEHIRNSGGTPPKWLEMPRYNLSRLLGAASAAAAVAGLAGSMALLVDLLQVAVLRGMGTPVGRLHHLALTSETAVINSNTLVAARGLSIFAMGMAAVLLRLFLRRQQPVYLVDFSVYRPPDSWKWSKQLHASRTKACGKFTPENQEFQAKILARSGLGEETYLPPGLAEQPPRVTMSDARWEFEQVCCSSVKEVLHKAGVSPQEVGVLIVNCSLFNPTPSLASMVMNHFKMASNTMSYNLGGMGCSAGPIAIDLARQTLQFHPNTYALVITTENITQNWYWGNNKSMLIPNCLFRVGAAAILLSNKAADARRSKYELACVVRTNLAANEAAYRCVHEMEDGAGERGVSLGKDLMAVAGQALKANITTLGPLVLPVTEQLRYAGNLLARRLLGKGALKPYVPNFRAAFDHVCIHTGGRGVIDEIQKQLSLNPDMAEPSRATLYRYGNQSSASIWYVLSYIESTGGVRRGDKVWQLGFGTGFKCNSAVWRALKGIQETHAAWQGFDRDQMRADLAQLPHH